VRLLLPLRGPARRSPLLALLVLLAVCARSKEPKREPTAANWRPILLAAKDVVKVPPPPGSAEARREIEELLRRQAKRGETEVAQVHQWNLNGCALWNEIARDLVAKHRAPHTMASRIYALLSVAQYDALLAAFHYKYVYKRPAPHQLYGELKPVVSFLGDPVYPSGPATVAAVSAAVLSYLFPGEAEFLAQKAREHQDTRVDTGIAYPSDIRAGDALGKEVAALVIKHAENDGTDNATTSPAPLSQGGHWASPRNKEPLDPGWGRVRPWLMNSGDQFLAPPPPNPGSPEFRAALAEVRQFSETRTAEQQRLAALWADGLGSYAPAGRWNATAATLVRKYKFSEIRAARVFALLNIALMDAGISAWNTKYHYLTKRPSQADPNIVTHIEEPVSPSYPCSHAAFSGAGAGVLGFLFPDEAEWLEAKAEEATMSRVFAGIQFRFEGEAGLKAGRAVAELAAQRARSDGAPEFLKPR
jgi:membrane-associated phospholipid phosphatase